MDILQILIGSPLNYLAIIVIIIIVGRIPGSTGLLQDYYFQIGQIVKEEMLTFRQVTIARSCISPRNNYLNINSVERVLITV